MSIRRKRLLAQRVLCDVPPWVIDQLIREANRVKRSVPFVAGSVLTGWAEDILKDDERIRSDLSRW